MNKRRFSIWGLSVALILSACPAHNPDLTAVQAADNISSPAERFGDSGGKSSAKAVGGKTSVVGGLITSEADPALNKLETGTLAVSDLDKRNC